jgi:hypothetical protein
MGFAMANAIGIQPPDAVLISNFLGLAHGECFMNRRVLSMLRKSVEFFAARTGSPWPKNRGWYKSGTSVETKQKRANSRSELTL